MSLRSKTLSDDEFVQLSKAVHQITGITIKEQRRTMLERRLGRRLIELDLIDYDTYLNVLLDSEEEQHTFINLVTTNETYFFRTPRIWNYINDKYLDEWYKKSDGRSFKAWSAAASTGEEAHSLGILLESFRRKNPKFEYEIQATDISTSVIKKAQVGLYKGKAISRFREERPALFKTFMTGNDVTGYSALTDIRVRINFDTANLFNLTADKKKYDLVLLRNVLIYFNKTDQAIVMNNVHDKLDKDGLAIIGESESLIYLDTRFEAVEHTIYRSGLSESPCLH